MNDFLTNIRFLQILAVLLALISIIAEIYFILSNVRKKIVRLSEFDSGGEAKYQNDNIKTTKQEQKKIKMVISAMDTPHQNLTEYFKPVHEICANIVDLSHLGVMWFIVSEEKKDLTEILIVDVKKENDMYIFSYQDDNIEIIKQVREKNTEAMDVVDIFCQVSAKYLELLKR